MMKYTVQDLKNNSKKYEENFKKLFKSVGTPRHGYYLQKEKELNNKDIEIRRYLYERGDRRWWVATDWTSNYKVETPWRQAWREKWRKRRRLK